MGQRVSMEVVVTSFDVSVGRIDDGSMWFTGGEFYAMRTLFEVRLRSRQGNLRTLQFYTRQ